MAGFEHLLKSYDIRDQLDDIASADPPAYLRRCFAEGISTPGLSLARVQQIAVCAMVLDSVLHERDYDSLEPELIADWRLHDGPAFAHLTEIAVSALRRGVEYLRRQDSAADAAVELETLEQRLDGA